MSHIVRFKVPTCDLGNSNIEIAVWQDEKVGTLLISKGAVVWRPKSGKKTFKMSWTKFDTMMQEGYKGGGK